MPVFVDNENQLKPSDAYLRSLELKAAKRRSKRQNPDPFFVFNPEPLKWRMSWTDDTKDPSRTSRVDKKRENLSAEVVPCAMGKEIYKIPERDLDKGNNVCRRSGLILMRIPFEEYESYMAENELEARSRVDKDVRAFNDATNEGKKATDAFNAMNGLEKQFGTGQGVALGSGIQGLNISATELQLILRMRQEINANPGAFPSLTPGDRARMDAVGNATPHYFAGDEAVIGQKTVTEIDTDVVKEDNGRVTSIPKTVAVKSVQKAESPLDSTHGS